MDLLNRSQFFHQAKEQVISRCKELDFDAALLTTYNSQLEQCTNFWTFAGHPESWGKKELNYIAVEIAKNTVINLTTEDPNKRIGGPTSPIPKFVASGYQVIDGFIHLGAIGIGGSAKRLWVVLGLRLSEFGFSVHWYEGEHCNKQFWGIRFLLGFLSLRFSRDK